MTDQERKAMEMALDALEDSMYPQKKQFDAIVGLKQALAQPEQEPVHFLANGVRYKVTHQGYYGCSIVGLPENLNGQWVALVEATDSKHLNCIAHQESTKPEQQPEPAIGDIRALKHRIHELEGELIGYKRLLDAQPEQEPVEPPSNKYNNKRIAWELERTAMGDGYYGNALYVAMDMAQTTQTDREVLHRYMNGSNLKTDHVKLQDLAMRIYTSPPSNPEQGCGECGVKASDGYALYCVKCVEPMFKQEWVSLTDEEIETLAEYRGVDGLFETTRTDFARDVENILKGRNT